MSTPEIILAVAGGFATIILVAGVGYVTGLHAMRNCHWSNCPLYSKFVDGDVECYLPSTLGACDTERIHGKRRERSGG